MHKINSDQYFIDLDVTSMKMLKNLCSLLIELTVVSLLNLVAG